MDVVLGRDTQWLIQEVQLTFEPTSKYSEVASSDDLQREGTFENLLRHRWRFWPHELSVTLVSEQVHEGQKCLQAGSQYGPLMAYQTVTVEPRSKYRLTGWIRFDLSPDKPTAKTTPANGDEMETDKEIVTQENASASDLISTPVPGPSIGLLNRPETSQAISATTDWKQVTLEFTTTEAETVVSPGFRFGLEGQLISGTAWFDDMKLEKIE